MILSLSSHKPEVPLVHQAPLNAVTRGNLLWISDGCQIIPNLYSYSFHFPLL